MMVFNEKKRWSKSNGGRRNRSRQATAAVVATSNSNSTIWLFCIWFRCSTHTHTHALYSMCIFTLFLRNFPLFIWICFVWQANNHFIYEPLTANQSHGLLFAFALALACSLCACPKWSLSPLLSLSFSLFYRQNSLFTSFSDQPVNEPPRAFLLSINFTSLKAVTIILQNVIMCRHECIYIYRRLFCMP